MARYHPSLERFQATMSHARLGVDSKSPLSYFFTDYFQDCWHEGFETNQFEALLDIFLIIVKTEMLEEIAKGIDAFLATNPTEQECDVWFNAHGGGAHDYTYHGFTTLTWIQYLRAKLEQPLREKVKERDKRLEVAKKFWDNQKKIKPKRG